MLATATLISALLSLSDTCLTHETAAANAEAAMAAAEATGIDAHVLLAIAYVESRFSPFAFSRFECPPEGSCKRKIGDWRRSTPPETFSVKHSRYCGVMQVGGWVTWAECLRLRDLEANYVEGARHLAEWMAHPKCLKAKNRLFCGLQGYNGGKPAIDGGWKSYAQGVLWVADGLARGAMRE